MNFNDPLEAVNSIVTFAALGVMWNLSNVGIKKFVAPEKMQWWRLGQAVAVGAVAGGVVAMRGGDPEPGEFELAAAVAVPAVDKGINVLRSGVRAAREQGDGDGEVDRDEVRAGVNAGLEAARGETPDGVEPGDDVEADPLDEEPLRSLMPSDDSDGASSGEWTADSP